MESKYCVHAVSMRDIDSARHYRIGVSTNELASFCIILFFVYYANYDQLKFFNLKSTLIAIFNSIMSLAHMIDGA